MGRSLGLFLQSKRVTNIQIHMTYEEICMMSGSVRSVGCSYAAMLIPGYMTLGVSRKDTKLDFVTRAENLELAIIMSACAVAMFKFKFPVWQ